MYSVARLRCTPAPCGRRRRHASSGAYRRDLAAERQGVYDAVTTSTAESTAAAQTVTSEPPFGLPVLGELPALTTVLDRLTVADSALLDAVAGLADLLAGDEVERTTGVGVEHWLAAVAAQTRMDRRLLLRACRLLHRLPTLDSAVRRHRISFAQLRGLTIGLRSLAKRLDGDVDRLLGAVLDGLDTLERADPDVLVRQVTDALDELDPDDLTQREREATSRRYLQLQARLDGTGGHVVADLDAAGMALLDAASTPSMDLVARVGSYGAARADTLLARLAGDCPDPHHSGPSEAANDDRPATDGDEGAVPTPDTAAGTIADSATGWWDDLAPPRLLLRLPFDALLDDRLPADLLTTLTGGRLRVTSAAARRLLDRAGARLRTIVVDDDGAVLGVGRASRQPPGWLTDALAAIHDTCSGAGCDRPARGAQADHALPWWPTRPDAPPGTTDLDSLGPLCAGTNRAKESAGWQVKQRRAGIRTWTHPRSGLTTTTVPATWRPPDDPRRGRRRPPRSAPPGHDGPGPHDAAKDPNLRPAEPDNEPGDDLPF